MIKLSDFERRAMCYSCGRRITNIMLVLFLAASWAGFILFAFSRLDKCPTMRKMESVK